MTFDVLLLVGKALQNIINERAYSIHSKEMGRGGGCGLGPNTPSPPLHPHPHTTSPPPTPTFLTPAVCTRLVTDIKAGANCHHPDPATLRICTLAFTPVFNTASRSISHVNLESNAGAVILTES